MKSTFLIVSMPLLLLSCNQNEQAEVKEKNRPSIECERILAVQPSERVNDSIFSRKELLEALELNLTTQEYRMLGKEVKEKRRAALIMMQFITTDKEHRKYSMDISRSEALEKGVSNEEYDRIVSEMEQLNKALADYPEVELLDVKQDYKKYKQRLDSIRSKKGEITIQDVNSIQYIDAEGPYSTNGTIITNGNEYGKDAFYPKNDVNKVRFNCRVFTSFSTLCVCKTEVGGTWNFNSGMTSSAWNAILEVLLAYSGSGVCASLYFGTMDSNGGVAAWRAIKRDL